MAIKLRLLGNDIIIGKRLFGVGREEKESFQITGQRYGSDVERERLIKKYRGIVYRCIEIIGEQAGLYEPIFYRGEGDDKTFITNHPFQRVLLHPSGTDYTKEMISRFDLFEALGSFLKIQGEAYFYIARGSITSQPRQIILLRADKVGVDLDDSGNVNGYYIRSHTGNPIPIATDEIIPFRKFNPDNPYRGFGPVEAGVDIIDTEKSTARFTSKFFDNNAGLSGVLNIKGDVSRGQFGKFVRAWRQKYEGIDSAGKIAIIRDTDAEFTKVGLGLDEIDMSGLRNMTIEQVCMMLGVPLALLGKAEQTGLGRANLEMFEYILQKYTIEPMFQRFDLGIKLAIDRYYGDDSVMVTHRSLVPEDKEYELLRQEKLVDKTITRNEARKREGYSEVDGGDLLYVPISSMPIDQPIVEPTNSSGKSVKHIVLKQHDTEE